MKGTIKKTLKNIGLSEKESEIYIFLGKRGPLKGSEISKQLKVNKGQAYRILKGLQKKGLVEATLEYPTRFTSVPFEKVIDSFIRAKREEVDQIEESKNDLLSDWKKISQTEIESSLEKFSVIEGEKKIFQKISQMIKETKTQFVSISSVYGLLRADHYGIFEDLMNHSLKKKLKFRFLTQLTKEDLKPIKTLLGKIEYDLDFKGKDPQRNSTISPRMVIKDNKEILLFISDDNDSSRKIEAVLCTNCQSIIKSFSSVFQDLWNGASDIKKRIAEIESGKPHSVMELIKDPTTAKKKYYDALDRARKDIMIVTSPKRLVEISKNIDLVRKWCKNGVSTKIMAPITSENLEATQKLLSCSEVRHIPIGYRETTIIDDRNLFQFNTPCEDIMDDCEILNLENVFFTNNTDYVKQTKKMLSDIWKNTHVPSNVKIEHNSFLPISKKVHIPLNKCDRYGLRQIEYSDIENISEKEVLEKFKEVKKSSSQNWSHTEWTDNLYFLGTRAFVSIKPPDYFGIPDIIIGIFQNIEASSFGQENILKIFMQSTKTPSTAYQLVAHVQDNQKSIPYRKKLLAGMPGGNNIIQVGPEQLNLRIYGSTLFAGWTVPIPLIPSNYVLPPSCILFEAYGDAKSGLFNFTFLSGRKQKVWFNTKEAFVTFFHPSAKYVGSGTEGFLDVDSVQISYPPTPI